MTIGRSALLYNKGESLAEAAFSFVLQQDIKEKAVFV